MWCKDCRKETDLNKCDVCGKTTITDIPYEAYWCDDCNIPLIIKATESERTVCPLCGKKVRYLTTDLRPVFPEERLLLELLFDNPLFARLGRKNENAEMAGISVRIHFNCDSRICAFGWL